MNYKLSIAQKVIAKLLQEFFRVDSCKVIAPVKHAFLHFATLSAIDEYLRIKMFAFPQVDYVKRKEKNWWLGRELNTLLNIHNAC